MRAVIVCGGSISDYDYIKKHIESDDIIICADRGYDHAVEMGLEANVIVGDFDSIRELPKDVKAIRYPVKKDMTDSEIAMEYARDMGIEHFLLIAAMGTRLDHTLTNVLMLKSCLKRGENAVIIDENNKIMITDSVLRLEEHAGAIVSLIPLCECDGVTTENMEYPLSGAVLHMGEGLGVSNVMTEDAACVSVKSGSLLVIVARD